MLYQATYETFGTVVTLPPRPNRFPTTSPQAQALVLERSLKNAPRRNIDRNNNQDQYFKGFKIPSKLSFRVRDPVSSLKMPLRSPV